MKAITIIYTGDLPTKLDLDKISEILDANLRVTTFTDEEINEMINESLLLKSKLTYLPKYSVSGIKVENGLDQALIYLKGLFGDPLIEGEDMFINNVKSKLLVMVSSTNKETFFNALSYFNNRCKKSLDLCTSKGFNKNIRIFLRNINRLK